MKRCQSCGKLIELLEDFAGLDQSSIYCSSCADDFGELRSFEEVLENLTQRIAKTDGFDESASRNAALQILGRQPAWEPKFVREEKVKRNYSRMILISMAIVLVLGAGGFSWWLRGQYVKSIDKPYELHYAELSNPFDNIKKKNIEGFEVTEYQCKGDQTIDKLTNGIMQFRSIEKSEIEIAQNIETIGSCQMSEYLVNLDSGENVNLTLANPNEPAGLAKIGKVVSNKIKTVNWWTKPKWRSPSQMATRSVWPMMDTNIQCEYDKDLGKCLFSSQSSLGELVYSFEGKILVCLPGSGVNESLGSNRKRFLCILENQLGENQILASMEITNCEVTPWWGIGEKGIVSIETDNKEDGYLIVADMNKNTFQKVILPKDVQPEFPFNNKDSKDENIWYVEKYNESKNIQELFVYNFKTNQCKLFASYPNYLTFSSMATINKRQTAILQGYDWKGEIDISIGDFWRIQEGSTEPKKVIETKFTKFQGVSGRYMVLLEYSNFNDDRMTQDQNNEKSSKMAILMLVDIETGNKFMLDDRIHGENVKVDRNIIAWTSYAGPKDDQWKNVCYTVLP